MKAIDIHVHPWTLDFMLKNDCIKTAVNFFRLKTEDLPRSTENIIEEMDEAHVDASVILGQDARSTRKPEFANYFLPNDFLYRLVDKYPKRFIAFAGIDPMKREEAEKELIRCVKDLHFSGVKLHCVAIGIYSNDVEFLYPIYERCQELKIPVLHHTGTTGLGNCKIKFGRPIFLDDVAQDFPDLKIIAAHFGWPWMEECFAVAIRNPNVYIDISGWLPRYLPPSVIQHVNGQLKDKMLFGTDYPMIKMTRWMKDFNTSLIPHLKPTVVSKLLAENAARILNI
jgi:predicted TIM-barrel fold metal-dependent hydrolase